MWCLAARFPMQMDALQPSGSFKLRGVGYACQRAAENGASQLVSSSGGNAGLAVAYAGEQIGLPVGMPPVKESTCITALGPSSVLLTVLYPRRSLLSCQRPLLPSFTTSCGEN